MRKIYKKSVALLLVLCLLFPSGTYASGEGNIDGGGGGMGQGTAENSWSNGNDGVRITVIRASDRAVVTTPVDFTNKTPNIQQHFGKVSKMQYANGRHIELTTQPYVFINLQIPIPAIISTKGTNNIAAIKKYFCSEYTLKRIAQATGMDYAVLTGGEYKILLEPIAYFKFQGVMHAMTATEAALYDEQTGGKLRSKMVSLSHKNLPLAMFLETADLGFPVWKGSRTKAASNADIKSSLGLGIVRFSEAEKQEISGYDYEYRVNTEVITAVTISGGESTPDYPAIVRFNIGGVIYTVNNVYYPEGDSQLAWVRWKTPPVPQEMDISVSVSGTGGAAGSTIHVKIVSLDENAPPNPVADDRNDSFSFESVATRPERTWAGWSVWRPSWHEDWQWHGGDEDGYWQDEGWWAFSVDHYSAGLIAGMSITPDGKNPTANGRTMKSGYGINQLVSAQISTNQSAAVTGAQTALSYFPEFHYKTYWRLLERSGTAYDARFSFKQNPYSTYQSRTHFTPVWMPDGTYTVSTWLLDVWTPAGMLCVNLSNSLRIRGNLWQDWHIAPRPV